MDLADLSLVENLAGQFGTALVNAGSISLATAPSVSSSITLDTNWNGDATTEMVDQVAHHLVALAIRSSLSSPWKLIPTPLVLRAN